MIPKVYTEKDFTKLLNRNGYFLRKQTGSHRIFTNGKEQISVPVHHGEIKKYVTNDLIKKYKLNV